MIFTLDLKTGAKHFNVVSKKNVQANIDALERCIKNRKVASDDVLLADTISILKGIQEQAEEDE